MRYPVLVSRTFQRQFNLLPADMQKRIRKGLKGLEEDPFKPRSSMDIKELQGTHPKKHRLRIGDYRVIYLVEKKVVKIIEVFHRKHGYKKQKNKFL